jgi:hypothetical protein
MTVLGPQPRVQITTASPLPTKVVLRLNATDCFLRAVLGPRHCFPIPGLLIFFIMTIMSHNYQGSTVRWNTLLIDRYTCTSPDTNHKYTYQG